VITEQPTQRRSRPGQPGRLHLRRRRHRPHLRDGPADHGGGKATEQRSDESRPGGAQGRGSAGEVAPPVAPQTQIGVSGPGLRCEVDDGVDRLHEHAQPPNQCEVIRRHHVFIFP